MSLVNKFQTSLGLRLTAMFIAVALIPIVIVGLISYERASGSMEKLALQALSAEAEGTSQEAITFVEQFTADILAMSDTPPVQAIIRAVDNGGIDPKSDDSFDVWVNRLTQIFRANAQTKGFYQQLRYLNEDGDEMVRVDFRNGQAIILSGTDKLQNKRSAAYFTEARDL